jgi:hypothetical protein
MEKDMNRDEKLRLLQRAYAIWLERYPKEDMDQVDCHLPEIQASLGLPKEITGFDEKEIEKP